VEQTGLEIGDPSLNVAEQIAHLHEAVASRARVGLAIGLIAAQFGVTSESAWRVLRRASMTSNIKLRRIAEILIEAHDGVLEEMEAEEGHAIATALALAVRHEGQSAPSMGPGRR